jgi:hypothetical protein
MICIRSRATIAIECSSTFLTLSKQKENRVDTNHTSLRRWDHNTTLRIILFPIWNFFRDGFRIYNKFIASVYRNRFRQACATRKRLTSCNTFWRKNDLSQRCSYWRVPGDSSLFCWCCWSDLVKFWAEFTVYNNRIYFKRLNFSHKNAVFEIEVASLS